MDHPTGPEESDTVDPTDSATGDETDRGEGRPSTRDFGRRSLLKLAGATAAGSAVGGASVFGTAGATPDVTPGDDYDVWTVTSAEVYDLSDGEELSNVLVDQTHPDGSLTIRSRNKSGWAVRNVGFLGVGKATDGSNRFHFQVSTPSGGHGLIENVWASGKARDGQSATELGGIYLRSSHAGHVDVRHTYIEGFGNNAVYASAVGKDSGNDGSVAIENAYHRDNTVSQFRIGSPGSVVRNSVGVVNDPEGLRGAYPGTSNHNARGVWGKHYPDQRIENCSFYVSPDDINTGGAFEARYISDRSHGPYAEVDVVDCDLNADAPTVSSSTANATVNVQNLGSSPTVAVIQDGGVPLSPEMAARGERAMPPELPGADGGTDDGSSSDLDRTLTVDGSGDRADYAFTVSEALEEANGSLGTGDSIDGTSASGYVVGGADEFRFAGEVTDFGLDGDATVLVDGQAIDPSTFDDAPELSNTLTIDGSGDRADYAFTVSEALEEANGSLGTGDSIDGTSASGFVVGGADEFRFAGEVTDFGLDGDATVLVNGEEMTGLGLPNRLVIDGRDTDGSTSYEFSVTGDLVIDPELGATDGVTVDGSTVTSTVDDGRDAFRFSGDLTKLFLDGNADITFEDNDG